MSDGLRLMPLADEVSHEAIGIYDQNRSSEIDLLAQRLPTPVANPIARLGYYGEAAPTEDGMLRYYKHFPPPRYHPPPSQRHISSTFPYPPSKPRLQHTKQFRIRRIQQRPCEHHAPLVSSKLHQEVHNTSTSNPNHTPHSQPMQREPAFRDYQERRERQQSNCQQWSSAGCERKGGDSEETELGEEEESTTFEAADFRPRQICLPRYNAVCFGAVLTPEMESRTEIERNRRQILACTDPALR